MRGRSTVGARRRSGVPLSAAQFGAKEEEEEGTVEFGVRTPPHCQAPRPFNLGGPDRSTERRRGSRQSAAAGKGPARSRLGREILMTKEASASRSRRGQARRRG
jgi:hypothetical protein